MFMITIFDSRSDNQLIKDIWEKIENMEEKTRTIKYIQAKSRQDMWTLLPVMIGLLTMYWGGARNMVAVGFVLLCLFVVLVLPNKKQCSFEIYVTEEIRRNNKQICG